MRHEALTQRIIGCFLVAYNEVGFGMPEAIYASALELLFREEGLEARREHRVDVTFRSSVIGNFRLDFLVEDTIVLELKAGALLLPGSRSQVLTYLRAADRTTGLLLFFGPTPEVQRISR